MYGFLASFSSSKSILADQNDSFPVLQRILKNGKYANFSPNHIISHLLVLNS